MTREEELHLYSQIKLNDRQALEKIFVLYYNTLSNFALTFLHDFDRAQEIVSDVFFIIWRDREKLDITSSLKGYLFKSVKNRCLGHKDISLKYCEEFNIDNPKHNLAVDITPESEYLFQELDNKYQEAFESLPPQCKLIFKLHKIDGLKYHEISTLLSLSIKTIESQMSKALKIIRSAVKGYQTLKG